MTFVFPENDRDFMQLLETRGNNGGVETVETVYVLTGRTPFVPEDLIPCDQPGLYNKATVDQFNVDLTKIAQRVADFYDDVEPGMVMFVHTHPDGGTEPSEQDKQAVDTWKQRFDQHVDAAEFFVGIHGLGAEEAVDRDWLRRPEQTEEHEISWWGMNRKHRLAVYDSAFEPRPVRLQSLAALYQEPVEPAQPQVQAQPEPEPEPEPEPQGEIWD